MSHKGPLELLDATLKDLRSNNDVLGRATLLHAGNFRQILPIVLKGSAAD